MKLPKQTAPVQRTSTAMAFSSQQGVEASDTIDDIFRVANGVTGTIGSLVGPFSGLLGGLI